MNCSVHLGQVFLPRVLRLQKLSLRDTSMGPQTLVEICKGIVKLPLKQLDIRENNYVFELEGSEGDSGRD